MRTPLLFSALIGFFSLFLVACGDDGGDEIDAGPNPCEAVDQCGSADQMLLQSLVPDGGGDVAPAILTACTDGMCNSVVFSGSDEEVIDCMNDCIGMSDLGPLSDGCTTCYSCTVTCGRGQCAAACIIPDAACDTCIRDNCTPAFEVCSGL